MIYGWSNRTIAARGIALKSADWQNSTPIPAASAIAEIAELKQRPGKNIGMTGSATLVSSLLREGPLDEPHLLIFPVLLGSGNRRSAAASGRPGGRRTARYGR